MTKNGWWVSVPYLGREGSGIEQAALYMYIVRSISRLASGSDEIAKP